MSGPSLDPRRIRKDFPILQRRIGEYPLTYLDNAATTQKPRAVIDAIVRFYESHNANVHRGVHTLSEESTQLYEDARATAARFIGAPTPDCIIFTRGTTDAINMVAQGWARRHLKPGEEILLTEMEHHSNIVPWQLVTQETGAKLRYIPVMEDGALDMVEGQRLMTAQTRLVALTDTSNVLGTANPVAQLTRMAHAVGALVLVDAAQSAPRRALNVAGIDCDFLAFSGHKMLGPMGIGVLYGKREALEAMAPPAGGGGMIREVWEDGASWHDLPWRLEAGTPNVAGAVGLAAAMDYLAGLDLRTVQAHEEELTTQALGLLAGVPGLRVYGAPENRGGVISFNVEGVHPHDVAQVLDEQGVAVRGGHHCCQLLMKRLGVAATVRMSFAPYNSQEDVERLVESLARVKEVFGNGG